MIEYVLICNNDDIYIKYKNIISDVMINYDYEYKYKKISEKNFKYEINKDTFKIYLIIDSSEYIKICEYIRENINDWQSMIITIGNNQKINSHYLIVDNIEHGPYETNKIKTAIQICLKYFDYRPNTLKFKYKNTLYNILQSKIIYIEKEENSKRCIVKTENEEYFIQETLKDIEEKLDDRFIKCNRSYIINIEQVESYNTKSNMILFKNKIELFISIRGKNNKLTSKLRNI